MPVKSPSTKSVNSRVDLMYGDCNELTILSAWGGFISDASETKITAGLATVPRFYECIATLTANVSGMASMFCVVGIRQNAEILCSSFVC